MLVNFCVIDRQYNRYNENANCDYCNVLFVAAGGNNAARIKRHVTSTFLAWYSFIHKLKYII